MPTIIELMLKRGYTPDQKGMCYGIAAMAAQAVIREDGERFSERIIAIKNITLEPETEKEKEREIAVEKHFQINAFLNGVSVYMGPSGMKNEDYIALDIGSNQDLMVGARFFAPLVKETDPSCITPKITHSFLSRFNEITLALFLEEIKKNNSGKSFSVIINYQRHSVQIGYDKKNGFLLTMMKQSMTTNFQM